MSTTKNAAAETDEPEQWFNIEFDDGKFVFIDQKTGKEAMRCMATVRLENMR